MLIMFALFIRLIYFVLRANILIKIMYQLYQITEYMYSEINFKYVPIVKYVEIF